MIPKYLNYPLDTTLEGISNPVKLDSIREDIEQLREDYKNSGNVRRAALLIHNLNEVEAVRRHLSDSASSLNDYIDSFYNEIKDPSIPQIMTALFICDLKTAIKFPFRTYSK